MRILSFILAFGFAFAAPSFNATADSKLPGAGAFHFENTTIAHLTLAPRGKRLPASAQGNAGDVARG